MDKQKQLALGIRIAVDTHDGQFDKSGQPYILHPLNLMSQLMFDVELATIAVLHDVVEDSKGKITIEVLRELGFSSRVLIAVDLLTHKPTDSYEEYIEKICPSYDAIRIKRKDLEHNSSITRLKGITAKDHARMDKYHKSFLILGEAKRKLVILYREVV